MSENGNNPMHRREFIQAGAAATAAAATLAQGAARPRLPANRPVPPTRKPIYPAGYWARQAPK